MITGHLKQSDDYTAILNLWYTWCNCQPGHIIVSVVTSSSGLMTVTQVHTCHSSSQKVVCCVCGCKTEEKKTVEAVWQEVTAQNMVLRRLQLPTQKSHKK